MKTKFFSAVLSVLFIATLTIPTILFLSVGENREGLLEEKRELSAFPCAFSKTFFSELENWYNDHAPYRLTIITKQKEIAQVYESKYRKLVHPVISRVFTPTWYKDETYLKRVSQQRPFFAPIEEKGAVYGREDWLFYINENNMDYFTGANLLAKDTMEKWRNSLEKLNEICASRGIKLVVFLAPNKEQVYEEYVPSYYISQKNTRALQFRQFMQDSAVNYLYPVEKLKEEKEKYDTYYKQDTHWNLIGAYIGATEIMDSLGIQVTPIEELDVQTVVKTGGDLTNFTGYSSDYTDYAVNYKPEIMVTTENYEDHCVEVLSTSGNTSNKLVMVSDSFRHAIKDFLAKEFSVSTVTECDFIHHEKIESAIRDLREDDVLVLLHVERYDYLFDYEANEIIEILQSNC